LGNDLKLYKYYQIADRIKSGSNVLDIGCGGGGLGEALTGKGCNLIGWDLSPDRTQERGKFYDSLVKKDIEKEEFGQEKYDVIVLADVLEHLTYPEKVLKKSRESLNSGGIVLVSLPNVAYLDNRIGLLKGNWNYTDHGILDQTHLKFFTLFTAEQLLLSAGYRIQEIDPETPSINSVWKSNIFSILSEAWPGLFAIGWVFQVEPVK
jgi:2-polyprenyl-3-methyl-5-hydroxy-6-metoxy-1,4-benzoquinol methylase